MPTQAPPDWGAWSREAVRLMQECNDAWVQDHSLQGRHYHWSLDDARLVFPSESDEVAADICVVEGRFRSDLPVGA